MLLRMLFGRKEMSELAPINAAVNAVVRQELPHNPEENPPETIKELDDLITALQLKSLDIKHQIELAEIREKQGEAVDYDRLRRARYARQRTNRSITALQKILKQKKMEAEGAHSKDFASTFVRIALSQLPYDTYTDLMEKTSARIAAASVQANTSPSEHLDNIIPDSVQ